MDHISKQALRKTRLKIQKDLNPQIALDYLLADGILLENDYENIKSQKTDREKTTMLLDILPKRGPDAFSSFKKALLYENSYPWLVRELESSFKELTFNKKRSKEEQLIAGGVPFKPNNYVERNGLITKISNLLLSIQERRGWVIIQGMAAAGKSVLASAVAENVIIDNFSKVHWISFGSKIDENGLLMKMQNLYEKISREFLSCLPQNIEQVSDRLRRLLLEEDNVNTLIVLDNVWNADILQAFNFGCCVLVTTQDIGLINDVTLHLPCVEKVSIEPGLMKDESLQLMANCLGTDVENLPKQAEEICNEFGGVPLAVALIGGQLSECPQDSDRWNRYLNIIRRRRSSGNQSNIFGNPKLSRAIGESVTNLEENLRNYYNYFVIFPDGSSVPREVFCTLWNCDEHSVDMIMADFVKKSLAIRNWNEERKTHFYKIHDLQLKYLQNSLSSKSKELHLELISHYKKACGGVWENLPCDGYIHWHLAYHLDCAGCHDMMEEIYFNLKFIIAKLKITGPVDVLYDFGKYGKNLRKKNIQIKRDFQHFIKSNLDLLSNNHCDIVQLALCQPSVSSVYQQGKNIAEGKNSNVYFDCRNNDIHVRYDLIGSMKHPGPVRCAKFTIGGKKVISCGSDELIRVWDCYSGKEIYRYKAHEDKILDCDISHDGTKLVTCSKDNTIKMLAIQSKDLEWLNGCNEDSDESPDIKPFITNPMNIFSSFNVNGKAFSITFPSVICCAISSDGLLVSAGNKKGVFKVWKIDLNIEIFSCEAHSQSITSIQCSPVEDLFVTGSSDGCVKLWKVNNNKKEQKVLMETDNMVNSNCFFSDGKRLASAVGTKIFIWNYHTKEKLVELEDPDDSQICSIAVSEDCKYLAAATASASVIIWSVKDKKIIGSHSSHKSWVQCVSFARSGNRLVSASDDNGIIVWNDFASHSCEETQYRSFCSTHFTNDAITVAIPDKNNEITILSFKDKNKISIKIPTDNLKSLISCCSLSRDLTKLAVGLESGIVKVWNKNEENWKLTDLCSSTQHSQCVKNCIFNKDASILLSASEDKTILIWRLGKSNFETITCCGHESDVNNLKFFHEESRFVSSSGDGKLMVWNSFDGALIYSCIGHQEGVLSFDISNNDKFLVSSSADKTAMLWSTYNGSLLNTFSHDSCVRTCCFSADARLLVTADDNGIVKVWNIKNSLQPLKFIEVGNCWIHDIVLSADSKYFITTSDSLKLWEVSTCKCLQTLCLKGRRAGHVTASHDFKHVVSVDDGGHLYVLSTIGNMI